MQAFFFGENTMMKIKRKRVPKEKPTIKQRLYPPEQAGFYMGFRSAWPMRTLAWNGEIPFVRTGKRRIAFDVEDLDKFIQERKTRAKGD